LVGVLQGAVVTILGCGEMSDGGAGGAGWGGGVQEKRAAVCGIETVISCRNKDDVFGCL